MEAAKSVEGLENEMVKLMAKRAHLGFTTHGHTGEDVFLYSYGPGKPVGLIENTDIKDDIYFYGIFTEERHVCFMVCGWSEILPG